MIINWEKGRQFFGNSDELYKRELFNFVHTVVPRNTERAVNYLFESKNRELIEELRELLGSAKYFKKLDLCGKIIKRN